MLFLLAIPGCGDGKPLPEWKITLEDLTATRCPAFSAADKGEGRRVTPRPREWKTKGVSVKELQARVDTLEMSEVAKNNVIERMDREHETCRGEGKTS